MVLAAGVAGARADDDGLRRAAGHLDGERTGQGGVGVGVDGVKISVGILGVEAGEKLLLEQRKRGRAEKGFGSPGACVPLGVDGADEGVVVRDQLVDRALDLSVVVADDDLDLLQASAGLSSARGQQLEGHAGNQVGHRVGGAGQVDAIDGELASAPETVGV